MKQTVCPRSALNPLQIHVNIAYFQTKRLNIVNMMYNIQFHFSSLNAITFSNAIIPNVIILLCASASSLIFLVEICKKGMLAFECFDVNRLVFSDQILESWF